MNDKWPPKIDKRRTVTWFYFCLPDERVF